jgi:hypothetical protein
VRKLAGGPIRASGHRGNRIALGIVARVLDLFLLVSGPTPQDFTQLLKPYRL